jgi:solute carrier family 38 (sodium-coupled neutral amino acid transporter), member 11
LLLVKTSKLAGRSSYQDLVEYCFGKIGLISISLFQFLFAFGGMCAYTVIVGDNLTIVFRKLLGNNSTSVFASRRFIIFLTSLCITFPLSLYRDISKLAKTSILAFFALLYIIIAVMIEGPRQDQSAKEFPSLDLIHPSFLQVFNTHNFADYSD